MCLSLSLSHSHREWQKSHLINLFAWDGTLIYIHQVWQCILHITHPDRFIMGGEPMPHIPPQPSIGQMPVALNLHWEPLHLKMEVRSLSPRHIGSERDQPALLKSFSLAALQHPTLMYSLDFTVFQKPSFVLFCFSCFSTILRNFSSLWIFYIRCMLRFWLICVTLTFTFVTHHNSLVRKIACCTEKMALHLFHWGLLIVHKRWKSLQGFLSCFWPISYVFKLIIGVV